MRLPPLAVLLSWPAPNYTDPHVHGHALLIVNLIFISLVVIAVVGRLYSRIIVKRWYGKDDAMIVLALVSCTPLGTATRWKQALTNIIRYSLLVRPSSSFLRMRFMAGTDMYGTCHRP